MSHELRDRNDRIYELATRSRRSTAALAKEFGLTPPRIFQIVQSVGRRRHRRKLTLEQLRQLEERRHTINE